MYSLQVILVIAFTCQNLVTCLSACRTYHRPRGYSQLGLLTYVREGKNQILLIWNPLGMFEYGTEPSGLNMRIRLLLTVFLRNNNPMVAVSLTKRPVVPRLSRRRRALD